MRRSTLTLGAAAIASILSASLMMSHPAQAASCRYEAYDALGNRIGYGHALFGTKKGACRRAKRRCNRSLKQRPFVGCRRVSEGQAR